MRDGGQQRRVDSAGERDDHGSETTEMVSELSELPLDVVLPIVDHIGSVPRL